MDDLNPVDVTLDPDFAHLWDWFWELHDGRADGFNGPQCIPYAEIDAWNRLTNADVSVEEVKILKAMDVSYLTGLSKWRAEIERRDKARQG